MGQQWLAAAALAGLLAVASLSPAAAEEARPSEDPGRLALEGVDRLLQALEVLIDRIPQYEMPVIDENGDIIIRRKRDPAPEVEEDVIVETEA